MKSKSVKIWSADTEDNSITRLQKKEKPKMLYGFLYDGQKYHKFSNYKEFLEPLRQNKQKQIIFFLNAEYDIGNIFRNDLDKLIITYIRSRFIMARIKGTRIYIYDSLNHWKISLKGMGEVVGLKKLEMNLDDENYCKRDCEILYKFVEFQSGMYKKYNSDFRATIAGNAIDIWTKNFIQPHYWRVKIPKNTREYFRKGYYGGRAEIFKTGLQNRSDIYVYDINSLFPYCMLINDYPDLKSIKKSPNLQKTGMTTCTVESNMKIPILPYRGDSLIFPNGRFSGTWTNNEIQYFIKQGGKILKVTSGVHFEKTVRPFTNFVKHFYSLRLNAKTNEEKYFYKILLNSLYGKFAQGNEIQTLQSGEINEKTSGLIFYDYKGMAYFVDNEKTNTSLYSNIIWSAYVTAYARIILHKLLVKDEKNLIYTDTDSIFTYNKNFPIGKEIGNLKLESKSHSGLFLLPKLYFLFNSKDELDKAANKGFPVSSDTMMRFLYQSGFSVRRKPIRLRSALSRGIEFNTWLFLLKFIKHNYNKRMVLKNGDTLPLLINQN